MTASEVLDRFGDLPFVLELELGSLSMTIQEIFELTENAVLRTEHPAGAPFTLSVGEVKLGEADAIVVENSMSIRVKKLAPPSKPGGGSHGAQ